MLLNIVFVVLLVLKLLGVLAVSWWVVFSPLLVVFVAWLFTFSLVVNAFRSI